MQLSTKERGWSRSPLGILVKAPKIDISHTEGQRRDTPERRLWQAVVLCAVDDLFLLPKLTDTQSPYAIEKMQQAKNIRKSAYSFLFVNTPLFAEHRQFVFESAGVAMPEMRELRTKADRFEAENS